MLCCYRDMWVWTSKVLWDAHCESGQCMLPFKVLFHDGNSVTVHKCCTWSSRKGSILIYAGKRGRQKALLFLLRDVVGICQHCQCINASGMHPIRTWWRGYPTFFHYHNQQSFGCSSHISIAHQLDLRQAVHKMVQRQVVCRSNVLTHARSLSAGDSRLVSNNNIKLLFCSITHGTAAGPSRLR